MRRFIPLALLALMIGCADQNSTGVSNGNPQNDQGHYHPMTDDTGQYQPADTGQHVTTPNNNNNNQPQQ